MPDINNAVALGIQPQKTPDIIGPISSLAQLSYMSANADKVKAETNQIGQTTQFTQGKLQALSDYNERVKGGEQPEVALQKSGLAAYDPAGATATLGNIKGGLELGAIRNYKPGDPTSLAAGGPELVGRELTNQKTSADTQKTNIEVTKEQSLLHGQLGNVMASDPSPEGRQQAAAIARKMGATEQEINGFLSLPNDKYVLAGQHFQQAAITPEKYLEASGQTKYNQNIADAASTIKQVPRTDALYMSPAAEAAMKGTPPSGALGQPSLGNFAPATSLPPPAAAPAALTGLGSAPLQGGLPPPASAAAAGPAVGGPNASPGPPVHNANAVATPSVGVNVPPEIATAAKKYGIDPEYLGRTYQIESGGNDQAYNSSSKAAGPFQFVPSTGAKYVPNGKVFDLASSAEGAAHLASDNKATLTQALGRDPSNAELYLAHQQGATGAAKLLANPNARAGDLVGNSAIAANGGNPNAPASAFTNLWATKFNGGVGKSIPSAAVAPNIMPVSPAAGGPVAPGAVAPLAAALTPQPQAASAPSVQQPPLQPAPIQNAAPAIPAATPVSISNAKPGATGLAADNAKPLTPVVSGMSPSSIAEQTQQGEAYGKLPEEFDKAASGAKMTNATLDEMANSSESWRMGKWADHEQSAKEGLQAIAKTFGVNTPGLDKPIADYQDFAKLSGNILRQASHDTSSRVGVQEMSLISKSLPNPEMSADGFKQVASQLKGFNDFAIAKQQAASVWKSANGNSLGPNKSGQDFQAAWNANASPAAFVMHRMEQENPQTVNNLISAMRKTPEGVAALKNISSQTRWASENGLFAK